MFVLFQRLCLSPFFHSQRMPFYAVAKGRAPGVYKTWDECKSQIEKFSGAAFKKFNTEAECYKFIVEKSGDFVTTSNDTVKPSTAAKPVAIPNPVAKKALLTKPSGSKFAAGTSGKQKTAKFTEPQRGPSNSSASSEGADIEFLANLGKCLKRRSTPYHDTRTTKMGRYEFDTDKLGYVHVYTDGSCVNNGKKGAKAGLGVYFGEDHPLNVGEPVRGKPTNNSGEIQASIKAIQLAKEQGIKRLCINTDSHFVINSITMWVKGWKAKGWKLASGEPVKNETDFRELDRLYNDDSMDIKWNYVKAHNGTLGNERADELAKEGAAMYNFKAHFNR